MKNNERTTIILVEDDSTICDATRLMLHGLCDVIAFTNAEAALTYLEIDKEHGIARDLILLDITLPGMSGTDLLIKLKQDEYLKRLPVILFSAVIDSVPPDVLALADGHIHKGTANSVVLLKEIDKVLGTNLLKAKEAP